MNYSRQVKIHLSDINFTSLCATHLRGHTEFPKAYLTSCITRDYQEQKAINRV